MHRLRVTAALVVLGVFALLATGCSFIGHYTVVNESGGTLLTQFTTTDCPNEGGRLRLKNNWTVVAPQEHYEVTTFFGTKCIVIADADRVVIATEKYSSGRTITVHPERRYEASADTGRQESFTADVPTPILIAGGIVFGAAALFALFITVQFFYRFYFGKKTEQPT
jgi:hypothetical protein